MTKSNNNDNGIQTDTMLPCHSLQWILYCQCCTTSKTRSMWLEQSIQFLHLQSTICSQLNATHLQQTLTEFFSISFARSLANYHFQGGNVIAGVSLFVHLSVHLLH